MLRAACFGSGVCRFQVAISLMDAPPTGYLKFKPSINQSAALDFRLGGAICLLFVMTD